MGLLECKKQLLNSTVPKMLKIPTIMSKPLVNIKIILLILTLTNVSVCFYCTEKFCEDQTAPWATPCPDVRNCTKIGYRTFLDPSPCNCCEYCFDYLKENDTCEISTHQKPTEMCGPHLKCVTQRTESQEAKCEKSNA